MLQVAVAVAARPVEPLVGGLQPTTWAARTAPSPSPSPAPETRDLVHRDLAWQFVLAGAPRTAANSGCAEACGGRYPSSVLYDDSRQAGLSDLHFVLTHVYSVAKSVCATPVWNDPWQMLTPKHNRGIELDHSWRWDRYFSLPEQPPPGRPGDEAASSVKIETEQGSTMLAHYEQVRRYAMDDKHTNRAERKSLSAPS